MRAKKNSSAFSRLLDWLENGDQALEAEMEDSLSEEGENALSDRAKRKKKKTKQTAFHKISSGRQAYADTWWYRALAIAVCVSLIGLLLYAVVRMPRFGEADTLIDSEVTEFILDYRGFDTLGESHVLFIAVCTVLLMLSIKGEKDEEKRLMENAYEQHFEPDHDLILQSAARILTPLTLVFGLYIIFNGHLSPGGGFSGGAILGAGLILYQNAFGYEKIEKFFTFKTFRWVSVCSLLFYSLAKGYHFFTGANHLDSGISPGVPGNIFSAGLLLPLNFVVGMVVACTMYALYTMFRKGEFWC